jgi:hypothetical protein
MFSEEEMSIPEDTEEVEPIEGANIEDDDNIHSVGSLREWFKEDAESMYEWRALARTDYDFYSSKQWDDDILDDLYEQDRPANTLNVIRPLVNLLSGYQRLNRYEPTFLSRNQANPALCQVRRGTTKFIFDESDYDSVESAVCMDAWICGMGWFKQWYTWDFATNQARIVEEKASPFDVYVDCNSVKPGCPDAQRIHEAHWKDKEEVKTWYPEHEAEIDAWSARYDEDEDCFGDDEGYWYQPDTNKCRLVETWWYEISTKQYYQLNDGSEIIADEMELDKAPMITQIVSKPYRQVMYAAYLGGVALEEPRPWQVNEFPLTLLWCYYLGEGDMYCGIVRDLIDSQREINKRRSDMIHILNKSTNSAWQFEQGTLSEAQREEYEENAAKPGAMLENKQGKPAPKRVDPPPIPTGVVEAEQMSRQDIYALSNINPQTMGSQLMQNAESGRAIELKQRQANAGTTILFDNLRFTKKQLMYKLWGRGENKGLVQKFFTDQQTIRIMDDSNRQQFITVNQQIEVVHPMLGVIHQTLNDLTVGEYDIVISEMPATPTQKMSQFWSMVDAIAQMGIPWEMTYDLILDLSDIPDKDEIKERIAKRMQQQQQTQAMQMQAQSAQKQLPPRVSVSMPFKDLPPNEQMQMAAKVGLQPQPQDFGIQQQPQLTPQQIAQAVLIRMAQAQQQAQPQQMQQQTNPALIQQQYLHNRPIHGVNRAYTPLSHEAI